MKILAIIPARGGSKRIERKNIRDFDGQPVIAYSIRSAIASGCFESVMVSTDDEEIAAVARNYGADVPFMRSEATSNDFATTADVIREVIVEYRKRGKEYDAICCLYATAPFVTAERLRAGAGILQQGEAHAAFTCVAYSYPTQRCLVIGQNGRIGMKYPEYASSRSQDLQPTYHDAGQFYFTTVKEFEKCGSLWGPDTLPIILPELEVQDLDTPTDWKIAEIKYRLLSMPKSFKTSHYSFIPYPEVPENLHNRILQERNAPDVRKFMDHPEEISPDEHSRFVKSLECNRNRQYYLVLTLDGSIAGSVNLERVDGPATLERGIWIAADQRGKGHAWQLLRELYAYLADRHGIREIRTHVRKGNTASVALENALGATLVEETGDYKNFELKL
ncbi:MAG: pseudaminic acid cytidylyltransferase [Muribaculaceae bacterium]|nr:pseudaminic acid cytidylyltransferase [Muribaculaceae bacterium]